MKFVTALLSSLTLLPALAFAQETPEASQLSVASSLGYESQYVNMGTQYAEAIFVPTVDVSYGNTYVGLWMGIPAENAERYVTEADLYAGWRHELTETFSVDLGATRYAYDEIGDDFLHDDNTLEFYAGVSANTMLSPSFYLYRDIDGNCNTFEASVSHGIDLAKQLSLNLAAQVGYISSDTESYEYYMTSADLEYKLAGNASAVAGARFGGSSDERIFGDINDPDPAKNAIWYGFGIRTGF
jgi:hypothetical protein